MMPDAITLLFKEAQDIFLPIEGKPMDDDLLSIQETLLPILMEIPNDLLGGSIPSWPSSRSPRGMLLTMVVPLSASPPASLSMMPALPTMPPQLFTSMPKQPTIQLDDYASFKAAEHGATKFLRKTINEVWFNDPKDAETFYMKVSALEIISFLANSRGLHAIDMISPWMNIFSTMHKRMASPSISTC